MEVKTIKANISVYDYIRSGNKLKTDDDIYIGYNKVEFYGMCDEDVVIKITGKMATDLGILVNKICVSQADLKINTDVIIASSIDFKHVVQREINFNG